MTNEEAKEYFLQHECVDDKQQSEAVWCAINSLGKQIPKKPIHDSFYYHCPICNGIVYKGRGCANNECRQAIDWSNDND